MHVHVSIQPTAMHLILPLSDSLSDLAVFKPSDLVAVSSVSVKYTT